ncbi:MAG: NADP-dependent phosphogluconate dehydrogenase [Boseongicola sp.]|nr:NADP-dependent phosphogluconate dehydrogenase [Boseongicola sp.]
MARIGVTGMGTMGAALALNIADNGFEVAVHNRSPGRTRDVMADAGALSQRLKPSETLEEFIASLTAPRAVLIMVNAGAVDAVIESLIPLLEPGDLIVDAGNANFNDTRRRAKAVEDAGMLFLGVGVSGGEEGARFGPSIMVGGSSDAYAPIKDIVEAIAARFEGDPCAAFLGTDGAGHFVKTVHNGIEYADMQLIAEAYGLLRADGRALADMAALFGQWNEGALQSYLIEITSEILKSKDSETGKPIVDVILDQAGQKGTGRWTVIEALKMGQSATAIESAVAARSWSALRETRAAAEAAFPLSGETSEVSDADLEAALLAARIITYGQGMALLAAASEEFNWSLDLARVAEIWRAGCIIRSSLLDDISSAVRDGLPHEQILLAPAFASRLRETVPALRRVVTAAMSAGQSVPAMAASLSFFDTLRRARGTTDLIQAQRDFFGRHGFQRVDRDGDGFHGPWAD